MTHDERVALLRDSGETVSPTVLAKVLGGTPYYYNLSAKEGTLKFPHYWRGRNLRIFTAPVIKIIEGGDVNCVF